MESGALVKRGAGGYAKNLELAATWYRKSAEQGHSGAMSNFAMRLEDGYRGGSSFSGRTEDEVLAWLRKSAEAGETAGQLNLAVRLVDRGEEEEGMRWFKRAAVQGEPKAMVALGQAYEKGKGVAKDDKFARALYQRAADRGYIPAYIRLGKLFAARKRWPNALEWYMKGVVAGDADCMTAVARHYFAGWGVPVSNEKGEYWLEQAEAARSNHAAHMATGGAGRGGEL